MNCQQKHYQSQTHTNFHQINMAHSRLLLLVLSLLLLLLLILMLKLRSESRNDEWKGRNTFWKRCSAWKMVETGMDRREAAAAKHQMKIFSSEPLGPRSSKCTRLLSVSEPIPSPSHPIQSKSPHSHSQNPIPIPGCFWPGSVSNCNIIK